jgi:hypothetical protein
MKKREGKNKEISLSEFTSSYLSKVIYHSKVIHVRENIFHARNSLLYLEF